MQGEDDPSIQPVHKDVESLRGKRNFNIAQLLILETDDIAAVQGTIDGCCLKQETFSQLYKS